LSVRAQISVHRVDADGVIDHEDLVLPWLERWHLLELEDRWAAILRYADGRRGQGSFCCGVRMGAYLLSDAGDAPLMVEVTTRQRGEQFD
jgi:hypothetical protein